MARRRKVLIVGGSGFVGSAVASQLAAAGVALVLPTRRRDRARHLLPLPTAEVVEADVFDPPTLRRLMAGVDAVVLEGRTYAVRAVPLGIARELVPAEVSIARIIRGLALANQAHGRSR